MRRVTLGLALLVVLSWASPAAAWTWPLGGDVLRPYSLGSDAYASGQHRGVDVAGVSGEIVRAPASGIVSFAGVVPGSGRTVTVQLDGYAVSLTHLGEISVAKGAPVVEGEAIGVAGQSGEAEWSTPYAHLGIRVSAAADGYVDPATLLPPRVVVPPPPAAAPVVAPAPAVTPAPVAAPPSVARVAVGEPASAPPISSTQGPAVVPAASPGTIVTTPMPAVAETPRPIDVGPTAFTPDDASVTTRDTIESDSTPHRVAGATSTFAVRRVIAGGVAVARVPRSTQPGRRAARGDTGGDDPERLRVRGQP